MPHGPSVRRFGSWLLASVAALLLASPAPAQRETRGGAAGEFDFYVLALSWSPGFCETEGDAKGRSQCDAGRKLGFVVHGLWPQFTRGFPSECGPAGRTPSRVAMEQARGVFPEEGLARHQWRKHGTCSGLSPSDYFAAAKKARDAINIPRPFAAPDAEQNWTPIDIERAFVAANPGLRTDMMAVECRRGTLSEVRICFSKDLRGFMTCGEVDRSGCRSRQIKAAPLR
jgi:ribonuclease T2